MISYYLVYLFLALKSLDETSLRNTFKNASQKTLILFFSIFIGLRTEVGCDWEQYIKLFDTIRRTSGTIFIPRLEPTYFFLNFIFMQWEYGYYFINLVCGIIFSYCLIKFCASLTRPWLALCIAYPYFIMVVSMGYTRQSVAIGISLLALTVLEKNQFYRSVLLIILASTFHRSALFYLFAPFLYTLQSGRFNNFIKFLITIPIGFYFIEQFILTKFEIFQSSYLDQNLTSSGAYIRVILLIIPSIIYLFNLKKFKLSDIYKKIFSVMAFTSFLALIVLGTNFSSTAVDRLALNLLPLQIVVASYMPDTGIFQIGKFPWKIFIILLSFSVLVVWLNYAVHSFCWIPYKNIIIPSS
tara:strand:- start:3204 stop:4268 length:1065 start_codon:yes stop_codon:yes gene_type:complete